jgi:hypothetical protein
MRRGPPRALLPRSGFAGFRFPRAPLTVSPRALKDPLLPLAECLAVLIVWFVDAGRVDRCIHRLNTQHPGVRFAVGNQHPLAHSHVLDTCVDRAILPFLEGFNQHVAPTFSSCQGVDMLPGRPGRWAQEPFLVVDGQYQPAVTAWAQRTAERYRISAVQMHNEGDPYHRVSVDFADTPMTWLG